MELICMIFLAAFGMFGGMFIGAGNRSGVVGALVCGALTGIALNLPFIRNGDRLSNIVLFCGALVGAMVINFIADESALKKRFLNQGGLRISLGKYYRIGRQ